MVAQAGDDEVVHTPTLSARIAVFCETGPGDHSSPGKLAQHGYRLNQPPTKTGRLSPPGPLQFTADLGDRFCSAATQPPSSPQFDYALPSAWNQMNYLHQTGTIAIQSRSPGRE